MAVGNASACNPRCCSQEGWRSSGCSHRRGCNDPVFCVTDLLIHLSREQQTKPASTVVEGENLDLLIGSQPLEGTEKDAVKAMTLKLLNDKYGIEEEDFLSAELEIVPAGKARELGMDASMILAYGQDDRVCAYTSLVAMLEVEAPRRHPVACS